MLLASIDIAIITDSVARQYNIFSQSARLNSVITIERESAANKSSKLRSKKIFIDLPSDFSPMQEAPSKAISRSWKIYFGSIIGYGTPQKISMPRRIMQSDVIET